MDGLVAGFVVTMGDVRGTVGRGVAAPTDWRGRGLDEDSPMGWRPWSGVISIPGRKGGGVEGAGRGRLSRN